MESIPLLSTVSKIFEANSSKAGLYKSFTLMMNSLRFIPLNTFASIRILLSWLPSIRIEYKELLRLGHFRKCNHKNEFQNSLIQYFQIQQKNCLLTSEILRLVSFQSDSNNTANLGYPLLLEF